MVNFFFIFRVKTENTELPFIFSGIFTFLISFLIVFLSAVNLMASSPPITNDDWYYLGNEIDGINGYVNDIIFKDSCIYVAGSFCAAGSVRAQSIAKWDGHRWHSLEKRSDGFTEIYALCFDKNGHLIVGGIFDSIGGVVSYNIARWNGEIWQPLNNCCNRSTKRRVINALACDADGNIYAGGEFDTIGEVRALNIARWDGEKWDSLGPGFTNLSTNDCYVENIVFDSYGNVYVSGSFTNAGDVEINNIAKWDGVRWSSLGDGLPIHVNSIVCDSSGNVFAAGRKDSIFKWDGEKWNRFANIKGTVYSLKIDKQNKLYVCGEFTMNESINAKSIAIWDGSVWSSPYPIDASNYMRYLAVDNSGNICTGGYLFEKVHDTDASNIIKWDGTSWRALGQRVWAVTNSNKKHVINDVLVVNENEIYVGGLSNFGYPSSLFSRWDGENWKILEPPSIDGLTQAICRDRFGNIYIAGELEKSLDKKYGNIVKWDGSNWHTLGTGTNGKIFALAADNKGNLYAGGAFDSAGGEIATCVAVWDGDKWSRLKAGMYNKNDTVFALACDKKGRLFAGGKFSFAGEATANCIAMWDGKVWNSLGSGLGENNKAAVYALAFDENDNLYVAGSFSTAGGLSAQNLAFWDGVQWHPMKSYMNYRINAIVCDKMGNVYVGHESDNKMSSLWKWDGNEWSSLGFGTRNGVVRALAIYDSSLYAGGTFQTAGNHYSPLFAKVNIHTMGVTKNLPELASDAIPKLSFYMQKSTLFFRNIDREDIISIYSLSGRLLRRYRGVSEIKLQEMGRQPFVLCVRRSGVDLVRSIMVKM